MTVVLLHGHLKRFWPNIFKGRLSQLCILLVITAKRYFLSYISSNSWSDPTSKKRRLSVLLKYSELPYMFQMNTKYFYCFNHWNERMSYYAGPTVTFWSINLSPIGETKNVWNTLRRKRISCSSYGIILTFNAMKNKQEDMHYFVSRIEPQTKKYNFNQPSLSEVFIKLRK
jgi:hypothetical protein